MVQSFDVQTHIVATRHQPDLLQSIPALSINKKQREYSPGDPDACQQIRAICSVQILNGLS